MDRSFFSNSLDLKSVLIEEIALNGLDGIGLHLLWQHVGKRLQAPVTEKLQQRLWVMISKLPDVLFYKLPQPLTRFLVQDRFSMVDEGSGHLMEPNEPLDGPYEYCLIENDNGSCANYKSRLLLPNATLQLMKYSDVESEYGDYLAIVASAEQRWQALAPHLPFTVISQLSPLQYCMLELIGRGRENGQTLIGKTNISKVLKDPKILFYNRLPMIKLGLITSLSITQCTGNKALKVQLTRLKRFHSTDIMCMPKSGKIRSMMELLKQRPNYTIDADEIIEQKIMTYKSLKVLDKRRGMFKMSDSDVTTEDGVPSKKRKIQKKLTLVPVSEESSDSNDEKELEPVKCRYKVGVGLLRQAYDLFLEEGMNGITLSELCQLLGIGFYTSRAICRFFVGRHLVKKTLETNSKSKTGRYVAVAVGKNTNKKYEEEKKKYQHYLDNPLQPEPVKEVKEENDPDLVNIQSQIEEIKVIPGCEKIVSQSLLKDKNPVTLRQFMFANGIIEVLREKKYVTGYGLLSNVVAERIKDTPLDSKIIKRCLQRLITDNQVKVLKMMWPNNPEKFLMLICTPILQINDPLLKAKYKEICMKDISDRAEKKQQDNTSNTNLNYLNQYSYPRYTKMQKLHSLLAGIVYEDNGKHDPHLPLGFCSFTTILSEMTVSLALGCLRNVSHSEISDIILSDEILTKKLSQCSSEVHDLLFRTGQFKPTLKFILKLLALTGMIRMIREPQVLESSQALMPCNMYYVCRNVTILNTVGKWPRVADLDKLKIHFTINSREDVSQLWDTMFKISMDTNVYGTRNNFRTFTNDMIDEKEAIERDTGALDGDGRGPCGFDSGFFLDSRHGWQNFIVRKVKKKISRKPKPPIKKTIKKRKLKLSKKANKKTRAPRAKPEKKKLEEEFATDDLQKDSNQDYKTYVWSSEEDFVLVMCKAAITIMSPKAHPGSLHVRNAAASDILTIKDPRKTSRACHYRAYILESDTEKCYEKECILNELRRHTNIIEVYENLFQTLRSKYTGSSWQFLKVARTRMMELVYIIWNIVKSDTYKKGSPCIAVNYEEFHKNFRMDVKSTVQNLYYTPDSEVSLATLKEGIAMAVMHTFNDSLTGPLASQIHSMFKSYPEPILRMAVDDLRKGGVLTTKERNGKQRDVKSMVKSYYKITFGYRRRFLNRYTEEFFATTAQTLQESGSDNNVKGSPAVNCIASELNAAGTLDVYEVAPATVIAPSTSLLREEEFNVLDIETKYKLKTGTVGWTAKNGDRLLPERLEKLKWTDLLKSIKEHLVWKFPEKNRKTLPKSVLLAYLKKKGEGGATFSDILKDNNLDETSLTQKLRELCSMGAITRVGYNDNIIIHFDFIKSRTLKVDDHFILPAPWLSMTSDVNIDILQKWMSAIVYRVFENPGISISSLANACEYLNAKCVQHICQFLREFNCVKLKIMETSEVDLFSDDAAISEKDFNEFESTRKMFVFPVVDMISTFSYVSALMDTEKETKCSSSSS